MLDRVFTVVIALIALAMLACLAGEPSTSPLDLRAAPGDTGTIWGQVRTSASWDSTSLPVPGAVVELGRWQGGAYDFRDSRGGGVAATPDDPRFRVVSRAMVDDTGSYRIGGVPLWEIFAIRARPPAGTAYRVTYDDSLFSLHKMGWGWFRIVLDSVTGR